MKDLEVKFDTNNIHSVVLNLLDGQVASKSNNIDNIPEIGKFIIKDGTKGKELKFIQF